MRIMTYLKEFSKLHLTQSTPESAEPPPVWGLLWGVQHLGLYSTVSTLQLGVGYQYLNNLWTMYRTLDLRFGERKKKSARNQLEIKPRTFRLLVWLHALLLSFTSYRIHVMFKSFTASYWHRSKLTSLLGSASGLRGLLADYTKQVKTSCMATLNLVYRAKLKAV